MAKVAEGMARVAWHRLRAVGSAANWRLRSRSRHGVAMAMSSHFLKTRSRRGQGDARTGGGRPEGVMSSPRGCRVAAARVEIVAE